MESIQSNIKLLERQISLCAEQCGRCPKDVTLLAVSKTRTPDEIRHAAAAGCRNFGESYLNEALEKIEALSDLPLIWHFIGPIQSNKSQHIAQHFDWVHSIDREKIARRLNDQRPDALPPLNVCIQVNVSAETGKSGVALQEVEPLAHFINTLPRLTLRGLMCIPQKTDPAYTELQRKPFRQLREIMEHLNRLSYKLDTLSMGMSGDYCAAILEGATIIRPGTLLFGPRPKT